MFDLYAKELIDSLPDLPNIDRVACRRALSIAYYYIVRQRLTTAQRTPSELDLEETRSLLRRMVDALESVAIFDALNGQEVSERVESACAFVAAESLALLAELSLPREFASSDDPILHEPNYVAIESALLYMVGGYDINAVTVTRSVDLPEVRPEQAEGSEGDRALNAAYALHRIYAFCQGTVKRPRPGPSPPTSPATAENPNYQEMLNELSARFYYRIGEALDNYLDWLGGYGSTGLDLAVSQLVTVRESTLASGYPGFSTFAEIYHLSSLLLAAIDRTSRRSTVNVTPPPDTPTSGEHVEAFNRYIRFRARGTEDDKGRPLLWPSSQSYINECLPGPDRSAVVAMPTGSGKSFVAELAIVHALSTGWVLYLAPTNALAHQIRRDLTRALKPLGRTLVKSFIGKQEYTTLSGEDLTFEDSNFVAVMTPEKCSVALRLYPEQFQYCTLCVFDECQLLADRERGSTADTVVAQLTTLAPSLRFVLMSAMVSNPDELTAWITGIHKSETVPLTIKWRPTRTLRGLLVIDAESMETNFAEAKRALEELPPRRINQKFNVALALVAGLSGPWTLDGPSDYRIASLPADFEAKASRRYPDAPLFDSWKNSAARILSAEFARSEIPAICFILSSRHHVFSNANQVTLSTAKDRELPEIVKAWLAIADAELGVETALRNLLQRGITVHSSAMVAPEHLASERAFKFGDVKLMFATPTLAQGLNLPAVAVTIAGTSTGDPRAIANSAVGDLDADSRINSLILNSFGRAGRPGFVNQGVAVLVSDAPFKATVVSDLDPTSALEQYPVLREPDAAVNVRSPMGSFIDRLLVLNSDISELTERELIIASLLAEHEVPEQSGGEIIARTLGAHQRRHRYPIYPTYVQQQIIAIKQAFHDRTECPDWINNAAMKAGVDFERARLMWESYQRRGLIPIDEEKNKNVTDWLRLVVDVLSQMPPIRIASYLTDTSGANTILTRMRDNIASISNVDSIPWQAPEDWHEHWTELMKLVFLYMNGSDYATIAAKYLGMPISSINNSRSSGSHPIPKILKIVRDVVDRLSIDSGLLLAIQEHSVHEGDRDLVPLPQALEALPLCVRNGCDSIGSLSWFRFGFRHRVCAHLLQRILPVPQDLAADDERMTWVTKTRSEWLEDRASEDEPPLLSWVRVILSEGKQSVQL